MELEEVKRKYTQLKREVSVIAYLVFCIVGCFVGWMVGRSVGRSVGWLVVKPVKGKYTLMIFLIAPQITDAKGKNLSAAINQVPFINFN